MHKSQILFCLRTVLHVSGFTITHLQEHKTTVNFVYYSVMVTRYCSYSCFVLLKMVIVKPETCRAVLRQNKLCDLYIFLGFIY